MPEAHGHGASPSVYVGEEEAGRLVTIDLALRLVEEGFRDLENGDAVTFPMVRERLMDGARFGVRSALLLEGSHRSQGIGLFPPE